MSAPAVETRKEIPETLNPVRILEVVKKAAEILPAEPWRFQEKFEEESMGLRYEFDYATDLAKKVRLGDGWEIEVMRDAVDSVLAGDLYVAVVEDSVWAVNRSTGEEWLLYLHVKDIIVRDLTRRKEH
jgi:Mg-chelatase subunit ChlI